MTTNKKKSDWKKYLIFAGMGLLFAGAMYAIFAPSAKEKEVQNQGMGLNTDIPDPSQSEIVNDKRAAYEREKVEQMQQERMKTLADFTGIADVEYRDVNVEDLSLVNDPATAQKSGHGSGNTQSSSMNSSVDAYRDMNRTIGSFYDQPKEEARVKQLKDEIEELKSQLDEKPKGATIEEQLALMEKSYQMAARFIPGADGTAGTSGTEGTTNMPKVSDVANVPAQTNKPTVVPVTSIQEQTVTALNQQMSIEEFQAAYSKERNMGFYSTAAGSQNTARNTIRACIHDDQTVSDGQETQRSVRIRLAEPMMAGGTVIPANTIITGQARIGERLDVSISSIEYMGRIYPTEITVYDVDGQRGIAIPPSMEVNAIKEIAANAGTSAGTSITFTQSAGQQVAADVSKGVIQGTSQYFSRKLRVMKVHLKAGHQVLLLPKESF